MQSKQPRGDVVKSRSEILLLFGVQGRTFAAMSVPPALCFRAVARRMAFLSVLLVATAAEAGGGRPLGDVITGLAARAGWQILFDPALVAGRLVEDDRGGDGPGRQLEHVLRAHGLRLQLVSPGVMLVVASVPAVSKQRPPPPVAGQDDILVTATKRPTMLAATAMALGVVRSTEIAGRGIGTLRDLASRHPELALTETAGGQRRLVIRGVQGAGEPTVAVYYDETPMSGPGGTGFDPGAVAPDLGLVDVERIEILRGPQGTLYGSSSMGGTVRILFHQPDPTRFDGEAATRAEVVEGGAATLGGSAIVNLPLVAERAAVRASIYRQQSPGYIDNPLLGRTNGNGSVETGGRMALGWIPRPGLTVTGTLVIQRARIGDAGFWYPRAGRYVNDQPTTTPQRSDIDLFSLVARSDGPAVSLVAALSRYAWRLTRNIDYTAVLSAQRESGAGCARLFGTPCNAGQQAEFASFVDGRLPAILHQPMAARSWNGELRASSAAGGATTWTAGVFFEDRSDETESLALKADSVSGRMIVPFDITGDRRISTHLAQQALFGEVTRRFGPWSATAGGRWFRYRRRGGGEVHVANIITGTALLADGAHATTDTGSSLKAALSWQPSADHLIYIQAAQGFRPGGVNITPDLSDEQRNYRSDRLWSYEAGGRLRLFDRRLSLGGALFRIDWRDMIQPLSSANGAFTYNVNVGHARIDGAEAEMVASVDADTDIELRLHLTDARLAGDQPVAGGIGRDGDSLPDVPRFALAAAVERGFAIGAAARGSVRIGLNHVGGSAAQFNPALPDYARTGPRTLVDVGAGVHAGPWNATIEVRNVFDAIAATRTLSNAFGTNQLYSSPPRRLNLVVSRRLGAD